MGALCVEHVCCGGALISVGVGLYKTGVWVRVWQLYHDKDPRRGSGVTIF